MRLKCVDETAKCPFFISTTSGSGYVGILCEPIMDEEDLGFRVTTHMRLASKKDLFDYTDIFCNDRWKTCPYAQAMLNIKYKEGEG